MEIEQENCFDTDLDDDEDTDSSNDCRLPRLSFQRKVALHRNNRLTETFGQINIPFQSNEEFELDREKLLPIRSQTPNNPVKNYEYSCHLLDITMDWQIRTLLAYDHIMIYHRTFSFNDIRAFSTAIEVNLENLTLSSIGLTTRMIRILCQGLIKCNRLKLLDLSYNKLNKISYDIVVETIERLPSLLYLSLSNCSIDDSYGTKINDLCRHKRLIEINLSGNQFEEISCILIGSALTENIRLTYLNLSWNHIRSYASIALFRGFEINKTLTEFDISWSGLGYDGSVALQRMLVVNKTLQNLNVSNCNIDWTCAKLISQGLAKNSTLKILNLSSNPLTTHGVQHIVQALNSRRNAVSLLDLSGICVFFETVRLAEKIAQRREFVMKYDFQVPIHDFLGRQQPTKADSMRKIIEHIDSRNWRPLDYYRILESRKQVQQPVSEAIPISNTENFQHNFFEQLVQPFTYKNLTSIIHQQRLRDRSLKVRQEKQEKDLKKRNQKILETVNQHFPDIDIISRQEKHQQVIEQLARPRMFSGQKKS